jgi:hypothetical protein
MTKFSVMTSVPTGSKADKIQDIVVKGLQIVFFIFHFKKLKLVRSTEIESDGDTSTDEHIYEFEY